MNTEKAKKKLTDVKIKFLQVLEERPLETIAALSAAALAVAKVISSVNEAQNARTWRKEVRRREQKQRMRDVNYPKR
jgi:phosphoribosylanthranilate isomerase